MGLLKFYLGFLFFKLYFDFDLDVDCLYSVFKKFILKLYGKKF